MYHLKKSKVVCPKDGYNLVIAYVIILPSGQEELQDTFCPRCSPKTMAEILKNTIRISDWIGEDGQGQRIKIYR